MKDYQFKYGDDVPVTPANRFDMNLEAIKIVKRLESQGREATPQEQAVLAKYAGFGDSAFNPAFRLGYRTAEGYSLSYAERNAWEKRGDELRELVTPEEYASIIESRVDAFYTTPEVIDAMWGGLRQMGADKLDNIRVLEPSAGAGRFLGRQPADMAAKSTRVAVELDDLTSKILKHTYPETQVFNSGFEDAPIADNSIDIAISNVPFGNTPISDEKYLDKPFLTQRVHNYFFAKTMDKLRPGGVMAFVSSHGTMDARTSREMRQWLADRGDLVGAVRLPRGAFPDTDVVTDIVFIRKRMPGEEPGDQSWVKTTQVGLTTPSGDSKNFSVNDYFIQNPQNVLGTESGKGTMRTRTGEYTVDKLDSRPLETAMPAALDRVGASARLEEAGELRAAETVEQKKDVAQEGKYVLDGGKLEVLRGGQSQAARLSAADAEKVRAMVSIRDKARRQLEIEQTGADAEEIEANRAALKSEYEAFVKAHGYLNRKANAELMADDPDSSFLRGLEVALPKQKPREQTRYAAAAIFTKRLMSPDRTQSVDGIADAVAVSINETGVLDFERIGRLVGKDAEAAKAEVLEKGLAYHNPDTGAWETADIYLSGHVRRKLENAEAMVKAGNAGYQKNVEELQKVQPEPVTAEDIHVSLGAGWVPEDVVESWIEDTLRPHNDYRMNARRGQKYYRYDDTLGEWVKTNKIVLPNHVSRNQWGTPEVPAEAVLDSVISGKPIVVKDKDSDGKEFVDREATVAAQGKAKEMREHFSGWVWENQSRRERLEEIYNRTHNDLRPKEYDGSHQTFPGMSADWKRKMRSHQRDAIYRGVQDGSVLLAHEVGFGKTAVMVATGMERKRLGLTKKPVYVVPAATHAQFREQFAEIYPNAKVLSPAGSFNAEDRKTFLARTRTGDWDAVILTYNQFEKIPLRPETRLAYTKEQENEVLNALDAEGLDVDFISANLNARGLTQKMSRTQKELVARLKKIRTRLKNTQLKLNKKTDVGGEHFEDLGIDQIFVDEADNFKNLWYYSSAFSDVKGLPKSDAERSQDMFMKTQWLQGNVLGDKPEGAKSTGGGPARTGVVFATGTPVSNTLAETWTMMRYLQRPELKKRGLDNFDSWARDYGEVTTGLEYTAGGTYKQVDRFASFNNLPELALLFQNVADIRVASETPEMLAQRPQLKDNDGNPKRIVVQAPSYPALKEYMSTIEARAENLPPDPSEDNMLKISTDARKASLDIRMVEWPEELKRKGIAQEPNPKGKIPLAAENIAQVYRDEMADKGTQLVFLDYGTPASKASKEGKKSGEEDDDEGDGEGGDDVEMALTAEEQQKLTELYSIMKTELVNKGVPENEIAFIHTATTREAKNALFEKIRQGDVRVLIGSTTKAGVGVNVQDRAAALHHIDVAWRPRDVEQREGRIIRQGNKVYGPKIDPDTGAVLDPGRGVKIFTYVQADSFDEFMWQGVEKKGLAIKSLVKRKVDQRKLEDIDEMIMGAAEAKALASGDPRVLKLVQLKQKLSLLRLQANSERNAAKNAETQKAHLEKQIARDKADLPKREKDSALAASILEGKGDFAMRVKGNSFDKRADADAAMLDAMQGLPFKGEWQKVGEYHGFDVEAVNQDNGYKLGLVNPESGQRYLSSVMQELTGSPSSRADRTLRGMVTSAKSLSDSIAQSEEALKYYQSQEGKQFSGQGDLAKVSAEVRQLEAELSGKEGVETADAVEYKADTQDTALITDAGDDSLQAAKEAVSKRLIDQMATSGRDFQWPDKDAFDKLVADELRTAQPAPEPPPPAEPESGVDILRRGGILPRPAPAPEPEAPPEPEPEPPAPSREEMLRTGGTLPVGRRPEPEPEAEAPAPVPETPAPPPAPEPEREDEPSEEEPYYYVETDDKGETTVHVEGRDTEEIAEVLDDLAEEVEKADAGPTPAPETPAPPPAPEREAEPEPPAPEAAAPPAAALRGVPKALGGRGRNREWGGLVQGNPQVGQTVTITTKRGKSFDQVVGEVLQTTSSGTVVRWAGEAPAPEPESAAPEPSPEPAPAVEVAPVPEPEPAPEPETRADGLAALRDAGWNTGTSRHDESRYYANKKTQLGRRARETDTFGFRWNPDSGRYDWWHTIPQRQGSVDKTIEGEVETLEEAIAIVQERERGALESARMGRYVWGDRSKSEPAPPKREVARSMPTSVDESAMTAQEFWEKHLKRAGSYDKFGTFKSNMHGDARAFIEANPELSMRLWESEQKQMKTRSLKVVEQERAKLRELLALPSAVAPMPEPEPAPAVESAPAPEPAPVAEPERPAPEPVSKDDRADEAWNILDEMDGPTRDTYEDLEDRLDFADDYERAKLAQKLGADPDPDVVEKEVAALRRVHELKTGQQDIFGATAEEPAKMVSPPPAPKPERPKPVELEAAKAQVKEAAADGEITAQEAKENAAAAGQVLSAAEKETPDGPTPERSYDSDSELARIVDELCDDPEKLEEVLARAKRSQDRSERETSSAGPREIEPSARSAAGQVLSRLGKDAPTPAVQVRRPKISDRDLLAAAVEKCETEGLTAPVFLEAEKFLRSGGSKRGSGNPKIQNLTMLDVSKGEKPPRSPSKKLRPRTGKGGGGSGGSSSPAYFSPNEFAGRR